MIALLCDYTGHETDTKEKTLGRVFSVPLKNIKRAGFPTRSKLIKSPCYLVGSLDLPLETERNDQSLGCYYQLRHRVYHLE